LILDKYIDLYYLERNREYSTPLLERKYVIEHNTLLINGIGIVDRIEKLVKGK